MRALPGLLKDALWKFFGDDCPAMAASLSFYTFFSLPALLTVLLGLAGRVWDPEALQQAIVGEIGGLIGRAGAEQVRAIISSAQQASGNPGVTAVLGAAALLFGATTAFAQLQAALNRAWNVKPDPARPMLRVFLVKRIFSFGVVIVVAFLLLVSLVLSAALAAFGGAMNARLASPVSNAILEGINALVTFAIIAGLFAVMFRYLPDARIAWRDVRSGAIATAVLFTLGKTAIGAYLGSTDPGSAYGAAGSLAIVLIWVYYSSMILLFGAELTRVWAERFGRGVEPEPGAVKVVAQERTVQRG